MKRCFVFGALEMKELVEKPTENDFVIAADKGVLTADKFGISLNLTVGDFDSLGFVPKGENVVKLNVRKDDTDIGYAVKTAFDNGYNDFVIYGGIGGMLSHTLANLQIAKDLAQKGAKVVLYGNSEKITVVKNSSLSFEKEKTGRVSVFSLSDESSGVDIQNLSYDVSNATLTNNAPLGVSNEFVGKEATVSVKNGILMVIEEK